jgi:polyisoprenoid-binding protein YceI
MSESEPRAVRYVLDAGSSTFTVQAFAGGLLPGLGHDPTIGIRDFEGEARFVPETFAEASLRIVVRARSLAVLDEMKEKDHREIERTMRDDVLEVDRYPEVVFQSTSIAPQRITEGRYKARIVGETTLHGVTRGGLWILAQFTVSGDEMRATGDFTLRQTDFGIKLVSVAGGVLKLKDELKFKFDLVGRRDGG